MELSERLERRRGTTTSALSRAVTLRGDDTTRVQRPLVAPVYRPRVILEKIDSLAGSRLLVGLKLFTTLADHLEVTRGAIFLPSLRDSSQYPCFAARGAVNGTISSAELSQWDQSVRFLNREEITRIFGEQSGRGVAIPLWHQGQLVGLFLIQEAPILRSHKEMLTLTLETIAPAAAKLLAQERNVPEMSAPRAEDTAGLPEGTSMEISLTPVGRRICQRISDTVSASLQEELQNLAGHLLHPVYRTEMLPTGDIRAYGDDPKGDNHELHRIHVSRTLLQLYCMELEEDEQLPESSGYT